MPSPFFMSVLIRSALEDLGSTWVSTEECLGLGMNVNDTAPNRVAARGISQREQRAATADALGAHRLCARQVDAAAHRFWLGAAGTGRVAAYRAS